MILNAQCFSKVAQVVMIIELTGFWKKEEERTAIPSGRSNFGVPKEEVWSMREEDESQ